MNERAPNFQRVLRPPPPPPSQPAAAAPLFRRRPAELRTEREEREEGREEGRKGLEAMHFYDATLAHMQQTHAGWTDGRTDGGAEGRKKKADAGQTGLPFLPLQNKL